ncbi:MAG: response regulator [Cyanomargarita calcarea GSE-NOS-MK-12-04C]|jgi:CheY-like chemotaxis protein|uniref:Response regulator n=1 Tax=Cyanomargarita calcarea GSE-NOS-MK-12-04C TaxID=2839659 RepID=A0A951UXB7_9CYAN|nr:response regulator [Cyanomargarita calcarea GSE-NOS-MK-12-04C]
MRDYIQRLLSASYTVQCVADGIAALNVIQNNPPDLVLTDMNGQAQVTDRQLIQRLT